MRSRETSSENLDDDAQEPKWVVHVIYHGRLGDIEVDYVVSDLADMAAIIATGPGMGSVKSIVAKHLVPPDEYKTIEDAYDAMHNPA